MRKNDSVKLLASTKFNYDMDQPYAMKFEAKGNKLAVFINGVCVLRVEDPESNYVCGGAGFLVEKGTILADGFVVTSA
jgi:hypothetical protein